LVIYETPEKRVLGAQTCRWNAAWRASTVPDAAGLPHVVDDT